MSRILALPFSIDATGAVAVEEHPANQLTDRVFSVVATQPGTRIMRPAYGTDIGQFVFGDGGALTEIDGFVEGADAADMTAVAKQTIAAYEPDAVLDRLRITQRPDSNGVMRVEIMYRPTAAAAAANPNVVVRDLVIGTVSDGTFSEGSPPPRPTFFDRTSPEYQIDNTQDDDGVTDDSVLNVFGWSTL